MRASVVAIIASAATLGESLTLATTPRRVVEAPTRRQWLAVLPACGLALAPECSRAEDAPPAVTPEEEEAARIERKLAAQRAAGSNEGKKSFARDLADERAKEKARKNKTKQEQREELCELLGRGC
mmetsp:Transcript_5897/g.17784  ORF Transcript_5897/g.17784 Transcript_5897/m.17784 type:complete len:126 (+) Transcript_5897:32-409(+)